MHRTLASLLVVALIGLFGFAADAGVRLSKKVYSKPTTAALNNAAYLMIRGQSSTRPEAAAIGQRLGFVQNAKYLKLGPVSSSSSGATQRIVVQTRRSVDGTRGGMPLGQTTISVRPVKQAGKIIGYRAYNGADPANKIFVNR